MKSCLPPASLNRLMFGLSLFIAGLVPSLSAQRISLTDAKAAPVTVEEVSINTEVTGRFAVTSFDLILRNPNSRVLEGSLEFPLEEGQSIIGLSLDINGRQREAVPVEKDRGRVVFEEIVRRGVDPALLEKTVGNNYRLRIYPIPARGTRRVVITTQEELSDLGDDRISRLSLDFPDQLKSFRLFAKVQTNDPGSVSIRSDLRLAPPAVNAKGEVLIEKTNFVAQGGFELVVPRSADAQVLTERHRDKEYFYAETPVMAVRPETRPVPKVIGLLWDASGSGRERQHARELALLEAWFRLVKNVEVRLQVFRDQALAPVVFQVHNGEWTGLRTTLEAMTYDGATSFDGLADDPAVDEWMLFSDGLANYGQIQSASALPMHGPLHTVLAGARSNPSVLQGLAQARGGVSVNLLRAKPAAAAKQLRQEQPRVLKVISNPEQVAQVYPEPGTPLTGDSLIITGRLKVPAAKIRVLVGTSAAKAREIELNLTSGYNPSRCAARAWASAKIRYLETDFAANREDIRRTSEEFRIVTAGTSLIVLENLQDYLRYDIIPPEDLFEEWLAQKRSTTETRWKDTQSKLDRLAPLFADRVKWWETRFPLPVVVPPAPAPVPAPVPAPAAAAGSTSMAHPINIPDHSVVALPTTTSELAGSFGEEVVVLSPFEITADEDVGYTAQDTLAGSRMRTELRDVANSVTVRNRTGPASDDDDESESPAGSSEIHLRPWKPDGGYLDRLRRAEPANRYAIYLEERSDHAAQPGFFLDVADFFFEQKEPALARRILSNLAELQLDDPALLRVLAHRLTEAGQPRLALPLFERVLVLRPEEPQSVRDLAQVCAAAGQPQRAVDLLWRVVTGSWDGRFPDIEMICLGELNAIVTTCGQPLDLAQIDRRFLQNLPVGLRVVLTWDSDACDIDLWVDDPEGERAFYGHQRTLQGGRMSRDFTGGYGPEEFLLRNPKTGKYTVRLNYFGDGRQTAIGPVTAQVRLITGFGTPGEKEQRLTVRLTGNKEVLEIGQIEINP